MHTKIFSATTIGIDTHLVEVEVDLSFGLLQFNIVGLPDTAIKESRQRILTALKNSGVKIPERKITVNLAPADIKKEGTLFDLPIAIGMLQSAGFINLDANFLKETLFFGELSLDGAIKPVKGALAIAYDACKFSKKRVIVPLDNAQEAGLIESLEIIGVNHLTQLVAYLKNEISISPTKTDYKSFLDSKELSEDFKNVKGQMQAKRALQIAAAGRHNIVFIGSPGSGKTMLAKCLPSIMPSMSFNEILEVSKIYSIAGKLNKKPLVIQRPFRNPHHTISSAGLIGGGSFPQPGEISMANHGILFLDEFTEFKKDVIEGLRQPLEGRTVSISRAQYSVSYPANFLLVAALNPCPCGFYGDKKRACTCNQQQINRYISKLSGPILDRIDLQIMVNGIDYETISQKQDSLQNSFELKTGVQKAITQQSKRYNGEFKFNSMINAREVEAFCKLTPDAQEILKIAYEKLSLTMRSYHKILKVARTIADLELSELIETSHIREALMYRCLDKTIDRI